jgi:hypothetical protein
MSDARPPHERHPPGWSWPDPARLGRRGALALLVAAATRAARADTALAEAPTLLVAGPAGGRLDRWATQLAAALTPVLPAGTLLLTTRVPPDGNTLLLAPGDAAMAWMVGDPRARFDAAKWLGVVAGIAPAVICARATMPRGEKLRVGMSGPVGPDLVALLGLELAGLPVVPVFGGLDRAVDAVLLRGAGVAANLGPLAQVGAVPLFTLGAIAGEGRDPLLPDLPNFSEFVAAGGVAPSPGLFAAWRGVAAAAQTEYALVLPHLTPAALVALWRQAGTQAAAAPDLLDTAGRTHSLGVPAAHILAQALAPDAAAINDLRAWLATRLNWRAPS